MGNDINKCIQIYKGQLENGYIQQAYTTLVKYVAELKANLCLI